MKSRVNFFLLASLRAFRAEQLGLLLLLIVAARLQAQSHGDVAVEATLDFRGQTISILPPPYIDRSATEAPTQILRIAPSVSFEDRCVARVRCATLFLLRAQSPERAEQGDGKKDDPKLPPVPVRNQRPTVFKENPYYKNKIEFSLDGGWLPINIPFVFDVFLGDAYTMTSLRYTLVPIIASIRWQINDVGGPWIFRGNWDVECSGAATFIPRGPETHYFAWIMGVRRNFVPHNERIAPYFDGRVGLGNIDAKGPAGVLYAQGQNFTFTVNMGSGIRYNFSPQYSISAGLNWMHISNLYLSEPKFANYGINVYGPLVGINVRLGRPHRHPSD